MKTSVIAVNESGGAPTLPQDGQQYFREDGEDYDQVARERNISEESQSEGRQREKGREHTLRIGKNPKAIAMTGGQAEGTREEGR